MNPATEVILVIIAWALAVEAIRWSPPLNAFWPLFGLVTAVVLTGHLVIRVGIG